MSNMITETEQMKQRIIEFSESHHQNTEARFYDHIHPRFVSCDPAEKTLVFAYDFDKWGSNLREIVHGGVLAGAMDQCMGILGFWATPGDVIPVTVSMQTSYLRPVPVNATMYVQAQVTSAGRTLQNVVAKAWVEGGSPDKPALTATAVYMTKR